VPRAGLQWRASLAFGMSALAKFLLKGVRSGLLTVLAAVSSTRGNLAFARRMLAFVFFGHMDGTLRKFIQSPERAAILGNSLAVNITKREDNGIRGVRETTCSDS
jgi:hypothetical protein